MTTTADKIRAAAKQYATYRNAADAAGVGQQQLNDWMSGRYTPALKNICRLAKAWGITVNDLIGD